MERDFTDSFHCTLLKDFNSHAHVERDFVHNGGTPSDKHFNSHAHVERDEVLFSLRRGKVISTHTLTWSVTYIKM